MNVRRNDQDEHDSFGSSTAQLPFTATALHNAQNRADAKSEEDNGGISMFWRVFGGTIVSIVALVGITLYNSMNSQIAELRGEIHKMNEARAELIKKDEFGNRIHNYTERVQQLQTQNNDQNATIRAMRTEIDGFKEKVTRNGTDIDAAKKDLATMDALKEKLTALAADLKLTREESLKLRQDVDKNLTSDQDRKSRRDEQYKEIDKALKEQTAALQALQIKLARLEGATEKPAKPPEPKPAEKKQDEK